MPRQTQRHWLDAAVSVHRRADLAGRASGAKTVQRRAGGNTPFTARELLKKVRSMLAKYVREHRPYPTTRLLGKQSRVPR